MKKLLSIFVLTALVVASCSKYDDTELHNKVNGYESRIAALEALSSYKDLLGKLSAGNTVTGFSQSGNEITLTFSDNTTVKFNQQGPKGDPGDPGESIKGDPGDPGTPGQDGKTPQFKIEGENWMVSYDEGKTWKNAGSAIDRSLIKDIKVEGDVLKITLADGTVIPVFYGEKEKFGFEIADGRRGFSLIEHIEWIWNREFDIPYTLTGDISSKDDVQMEVHVIPRSYSAITGMYDMATVVANDAKSGHIHVKQRLDSQYRGWDGGEYYDDYPAFDIDVTAHFPDGTSSYKKLHVAGYEMYSESGDWENYYLDYDNTQRSCRIDLPADAGSFVLKMRINTTGNYDVYDGDPLSAWPGDQIFYLRRSTGGNFISSATSEPRITQSATIWESHYDVTISFTKNTTGAERNEKVVVFQRHSTTGATNFMYLYFVQAAH